MEKSIFNELGFIGSFLRFMDEHQTLANVILILETLALFWAVLTYNFTTNF
jgi:hypothetical protein